jgi:hypothetical protein
LQSAFPSTLPYTCARHVNKIMLFRVGSLHL